MLARGRLSLQHDLPAGKMDRDIETGRAWHQRTIEKPLDRIRAAQHRRAIAQIMHGACRQYLGQGLADQFVRCPPDEVGDVRRHPGDDPVGRQREQETDGLDAAQDVNGFTVAVGKIDRCFYICQSQSALIFA